MRVSKKRSTRQQAHAAAPSPESTMQLLSKNLTAIEVLLLLLLVVYAATGSILAGVAVVLLIFLIVYLEIKSSVRAEGTRKTSIDVAVAVGSAVLVWALLIFFLHTTAPVDAVSSCSMLPVLHRGDLVILHGIDNMSSFVASKHVPLINVTGSEYSRMLGNMTNEFLAYFAYFNNKSQVSYVILNRSVKYQVGLYSTRCIINTNYNATTSATSSGQQANLAQCYVPQQAQQSNLIQYSYAIGNVSTGNHRFSAIYTSAVTVHNTTYPENYSNPIVVYQTSRIDSFSGSIVHRVYAVLNANGRYYFLTKGDNNQALDIQFGNYPANRTDVLGYVIADIPLVGYVKLLLSGQIATPAGCNQTLSAH